MEVSNSKHVATTAASEAVAWSVVSCQRSGDVCASEFVARSPVLSLARSLFVFLGAAS